MPEDFLVLEGITKAFPGLIANNNINLNIKKGEVHALLGENGAGKSTLMKILYGVYRADSGTITVDGQQVQIRSPHDAREAGIGIVFQSFMLIPAFTVIENVALGLKNLGIIFDVKDIEKQIVEISERFGFGIDPGARVWQLTIGAQQKVEIIKLLLAGAKLLIFDEPTSVLAPHEAESLFEIFNSLRRNDYTIIFISHKLQEVLSCSDNITVLRKGKVVGSISRAEATEQILVNMIVGSSDFHSSVYDKGSGVVAGQPYLQLKGVEAIDERGRLALRGVDFSIHSGEILGVAGVSGNGQKELGEVIQGARRLKNGSILLNGQDTKGWSIARIRNSGVTCVPEDPLKMGAVRSMSVLENLALADVSDPKGRGWLPMNWKTARLKSSWLTDKFRLSMPPLTSTIDTLSGGNIQRVIFARELADQPKLLLAYYPTRGLDIGAAEIIRRALIACREEGAAILLISEDLDELFALSNRIIVMYHGKSVGEGRPEEMDRTR